jgi:hypothetical protein
MIHYNVWFTFLPDVYEVAELIKTRRLLDDFKSRGMLADYRLLTNRASGAKTKVPKFQVIIEFTDDTQFGLPFAEVEHIGIRSGQHGAMIEHVDEFVVEVFKEI